jgi:hypothetical protein
MNEHFACEPTNVVDESVWHGRETWLRRRRLVELTHQGPQCSTEAHDLDREFANIVTSMCAPEPGRRPTALEAFGAFAQIRRRLPVSGVIEQFPVHLRALVDGHVSSSVIWSPILGHRLATVAVVLEDLAVRALNTAPRQLMIPPLRHISTTPRSVSLDTSRPGAPHRHWDDVVNSVESALVARARHYLAHPLEEQLHERLECAPSEVAWRLRQALEKMSSALANATAEPAICTAFTAWITRISSDE